MGEPAVELGEKELEKIGTYVKRHLPEWMGELRHEHELELVERIVRVEEEVKSSREVMEARFAAVYERFTAVDKRFEMLQENSDRQFKNMDQRFEMLQENSDRQFKSMDQRFETLQESNNKRFSSIDQRFEDMNRRFSQVQWMMGIGFTLLAALLGIFNFF